MNFVVLEECECLSSSSSEEELLKSGLLIDLNSSSNVSNHNIVTISDEGLSLSASCVDRNMTLLCFFVDFNGTSSNITLDLASLQPWQDDLDIFQDFLVVEHSVEAFIHFS